MKKLLILSIVFFFSCKKKDTCVDVCLKNNLNNTQSNTKDTMSNGQYVFFTSNTASTTFTILFYGKDTLTFPKEKFVRYKSYEPLCSDTLYSSIDTLPGTYYIEVFNWAYNKSKGIKPIIIESGICKKYDIH